jgi:hypothetical protein
MPKALFDNLRVNLRGQHVTGVDVQCRVTAQFSRNADITRGGLQGCTADLSVSLRSAIIHRTAIFNSPRVTEKGDPAVDSLYSMR